MDKFFYALYAFAMKQFLVSMEDKGGETNTCCQQSQRYLKSWSFNNGFMEIPNQA